MANEPIKYDQTRQQIAEAQAVDEVLDIRARMEALVKYFSRKLDPEQERQARELQLLAERRLGEMSLTLKKDQGARNDLSAHGGEVDSKIETLKSAGISTQKASEYERLAKMPKAEFDEAAHKGKSAKSVLKKAAPKPSERHAASLHLDHGKTLEQAAAEGGLSSVQPVKTAVAYELGRREAAAEAPIPFDTFSMSVQEKIEAWKRQQFKQMEAEFENRVRAECHKQMEETFLPYYKEKEVLYDSIVKTRKGMMTRAVYNKIRSCLHPDRVQDVGQKRFYEEAFACSMISNSSS